MKQNRNVDRKRQIHRNSKTHIRTVGEAVEKQSSHSLIPIQTNVNNALSTPMQRNIKNNIKTITERANALNNNTAPLPKIVSASNVGAYVNQIDIIRSIINLESITSNISQNFTFIDGGGSGDKIIINNIWKDDNNEYADKKWVLEQIAGAVGGGGGSVDLSDYIKFGENTSLSTVIIKSPDNNDNNLQMNNHTFMLNRANNLNLKLTLDEASREARIFTGNTLYLRAETLKFNTANDSIMFHYDYQTCEMRSNDFIFRTNADNKELLKINDNTITYKGQPIIGTGGGSVDLTSYIHMGSNVVTTPIQLMTDTNTNTNENIYITGNSIRYYTNKAVDGQWTIRGHVTDIPSDIPRDGTYFNLLAPRMMFSIYKEFIITNYDNSETILRVNNDTITWKGQSLINSGGTVDLSNYIRFGTNVAASSTAAVSISHNNEIITTTPQKLEINDGLGNCMHIDRQSISVYTDSNKSFDIYVNPSNKGMNIKTSTLTVESPEVEFRGDTFGIYHGTKVYPTCEITDDSFIIDGATLIMQLGSGTKFLQINDNTFEWGGYAMLHEGTNNITRSIELHDNSQNIFTIAGKSITYFTTESGFNTWSVQAAGSGPMDIGELTYKPFFYIASQNILFNCTNGEFLVCDGLNTTVLRVNNNDITYKGQSLVNQDLSTYIHGGDNTNIPDITVFRGDRDTINGEYYLIRPEGLEFYSNSGYFYLYYSSDKNCTWFWNQTHPLEIYFNTVTIASNSGNISLISNSFTGNNTYSINLTTTGVVSIFNNEFLLNKNSQNDLSNPYFKVTPDTIEWNGQPIIGTGGGIIDTSNFITKGSNTIDPGKYVSLYATNSKNEMCLTPNYLFYKNNGTNSAEMGYVNSKDLVFKLYNNTATFAVLTQHEFILSSDTQSYSNKVFFKISPYTIEWRGTNLICAGDNGIQQPIVLYDLGRTHKLSISYESIQYESGDNNFTIQIVNNLITDIPELTNEQPFLYIVSDYISPMCNDFIISTRENKSLLRVNDNTITYKGQSLLVDTNNFITNGENVNKSVTFISDSDRPKVTISNTSINLYGANSSQRFSITSSTGIGINDVLFVARLNSMLNMCDSYRLESRNSIYVNLFNFVEFSAIPDGGYIKNFNFDGNDFDIEGKFSFVFNTNEDVNSISFKQKDFHNNYTKKNFGFVKSNENDSKIYVFYSEKDSSKYQFGIRNFDEVNFVLTNNINAYDLSAASYTWSFKADNLYHNGAPYVSKSFTVTHISPIDENYTYDDFTIGLPVYMSGKVYIKDYENKIWKLSTRNDTIDCISSIKPTGVLKEYLGICVSKETDEITFASHGDFLVKVGDSSKYEIGDIIYINDNINNSISILVLDENTPLTAKINKSIIGTITSIIDSEFVAVFRD